MTHDPMHDPLCPYMPEQQGFGGLSSGVSSTQPFVPGVPCQCALIKRVVDQAIRDCIAAVVCCADCTIDALRALLEGEQS